jgi:hypothetical protein
METSVAWRKEEREREERREGTIFGDDEDEDEGWL